MPRQIIMLTGWLVCLFVPSLYADNQALLEKIRPSIAKVYATVDGKEYQASGFVWGHERQVITALHSVAGCSEIKIFFEETGDLFLAELDKVYLAADLASLAILDDNATLPVLYSSPTKPRMSEMVFAPGYPLNVRTMDGLHCRVGFGGKQLKDVVNDSVLVLINENGFPSGDIEVVRLEEVITYGLSGAPIINTNGEVVGVADGGIDGGQTNINWAIPATYLERLETSTDPKPRGSRSNRTLFRAELNPPKEQKTITLAQPEYSQSSGAFDQSLYDLILSLYGGSVDEQTARTVASGNYDINFGETFDYEPLQPSLTLIKTRSLGEIQATSDDPGNLYTLLSNFTLNTWQDPYTMEFDIYQDANSGATLVAPKGLELFVEGNVIYGQWFDEIDMVYQVQWAANFDDALNQSYAFEGMIAPASYDAYWNVDPNFSYSTPYYRYDGATIMRKGAYQYNLYNLPIAYAYETLATRGETFMGAAAKHYNMDLDNPVWEPDFAYAWAQAMIAVFLTTFQ